MKNDEKQENKKRMTKETMNNIKELIEVLPVILELSDDNLVFLQDFIDKELEERNNRQTRV